MNTLSRFGVGWSRGLRAAMLAGGVALAGCAPLMTQNPGGQISPANVVADGSDEHLMLFGHDVVSYFAEGSHRLGDPAIKSVHEGVTFRFASAEHKAMFDADPARYVPQFGGYCANGISYGIPWGGDADTWKIIDDRLYIFGGKGSYDAFMLDPAGNIALAQQYWRDEIQGSNALVQRLKRLTFRVPHYKSGEELAAMVRAKAAN